MRLRPPFFPGPNQQKCRLKLPGGTLTGSTLLIPCAQHFSTKVRGLHATLVAYSRTLLRKPGLEERRAVLVDLDGAGLLELLRAERPAGEDGHRPDAGLVRGLDVPYGVPHGNGLVRRGARLLQGETEDVGRGLGVLDGTRVDDAGDPAL